MSDAYPPHEQLRHLAEATRHLLEGHNCDHDGWETWGQALAAYDAGDASDATHFVSVDGQRWALQHPLTCRPDLLACGFTELVSEAMTPVPTYGPGRYRALVNGAGELRLERI